MLLSVHSCLEPPVTPNHVLVKLLGDVEVRHAYQITAVLQTKKKRENTELPSCMGKECFWQRWLGAKDETPLTTPPNVSDYK